MNLVIDEIAISAMLERYRKSLEDAEVTKKRQFEFARRTCQKHIAEAELMYDGKVGVAFEVLKSEVIKAREKYDEEEKYEAEKG